jgi:hypothetical protein
MATFAQAIQENLTSWFSNISEYIEIFSCERVSRHVSPYMCSFTARRNNFLYEELNLACYCMTPYLQHFFDKNQYKSQQKVAIITMMA